MPAQFLSGVQSVEMNPLMVLSSDAGSIKVTCAGDLKGLLGGTEISCTALIPLVLMERGGTRMR